MTLASLNRPTLSLCAIVKNEAPNLGRCLESVKPYVDEMVVVDTGSEDQTPDIAKQYGAKVDHFTWCDDFAAARNYALSLVSSEWVLLLDADEELVVETETWKQVLKLQPELLAYVLTRIDLHEMDDVIGGAHLRLFRNLPGMKYVGRYHEQLEYLNAQKLTVGVLEGIKILHHGNSDARILEKNQHRDIPLLERMREEEGLDLWRLDCLARKYIKVGQLQQAQECYIEALDRLTPHLIEGNPPENFFWIPTLLESLGSQAIEAEDYETARLICQRGLEWCPQHPPLNYLTGELQMALGFPLAAKAYFEYCLQMGQNGSYYKTDPVPGCFVTTFPAYGLGCAHVNLQRWQEAIAAFELALTFDPNYTPAQEQLTKARAMCNTASAQP